MGKCHCITFYLPLYLHQKLKQIQIIKHMYEVVKHPEKYRVYTSDDYSECVAYLKTMNDLFKRFSLETQQTETFLTVQHNTSETVYSIEYINQN